ncbi:MAG: hypothetical protein JNG88_04975 [Phycisphaerales bacterium]|nr:hypothetical protein [Phycisphaerales bacterium]
MSERRPQINFQVEPALKLLYEEARAEGHWVTRLCAAGLLLMVEDDAARSAAITRLRDWELEYADASQDEIRDFVRGVGRAMRNASRGTPRGRTTRRARKKAKRDGSA